MAFRASLILAALAASLIASQPAHAAQCGDNSTGFAGWLTDFRKEAAAAGIRPDVLNAALGNAQYATKTIWLDRNQKSFKLTFDQFMKKRGAETIIVRGKKLKRQNEELFARIEARFGVPAGPLVAIWGMETAFGAFQGDQGAFSALATLAYDCRRSEFFQGQLYSALKLVQTGQLRVDEMIGAGHGEIGQMQFLPTNYLEYGVDGDGDGRVDMIASPADALSSTANYLRAYGWTPGVGYQEGEANFTAIQGWNKAGVYQKAIAVIAKAIDS